MYPIYEITICQISHETKDTLFKTFAAENMFD